MGWIMARKQDLKVKLEASDFILINKNVTLVNIN